MASHTTIEEIDVDEVPKIRSPFQHIFEEHQQKPYKFLASAFEFLSQETSFFEQPDASKLLARLLRDTKAKKAPTKPVAATPSAANGSLATSVSLLVDGTSDQLSPRSTLDLTIRPAEIAPSAHVGVFLVICLHYDMQRG